MKSNKRKYLKERIEQLLIIVNALIIMFIATTIETLGNVTYNKILIVLFIIMFINTKVLTKYGKSFR